jgi:hypothetical protein
MKEIKRNTTEEQIDEMINLSWDFFVNQMISKKFIVDKEAQFQFYFGNIIKDISKFYESSSMQIDVRVEDKRLMDKKQRIDIMILCNDNLKIPIELKFIKKATNKKNKYNTTDAFKNCYKDIHRLDSLVNTKDVPIAYFFAICETDDAIKDPEKGSEKLDFKISDGAKIEIGRKKSRDGQIDLGFKSKHEFKWAKSSDLDIYFLKMKI